ncbi:MAG: VUT family protein [Deltaproteobacteria bacterium]|nr:MAG: VUT family protein [Deltaproteobacteria bacterium]RLB77160.1 MAG: VUT family protein [Deltaproteobacteria bacterium]
MNKTSGHNNYSSFFLVITAVFVTALIASNIIAVKLICVFGLVLPAAIVIFPISYIIGDVLTEVYGYGQARRVIWLGFACNLLVVLVFWIGKILPPAPFWKYQQAYAQILGFTPRLVMASFLAYLVGEFSNSFVLAKMKLATRGRWLWTRTIGSTLVGEGLDSLVFMGVAFYGVVPNRILATAVLTQWLVKCTYEALATPITYLVVDFLKRREGIDVYDHDTSFSPLIFTRN